EPEFSTAPPEAGPLQEPCMSAPAPDDAQASQDHVTICHIPPGNPANAHSITVGAPAVSAHLAHGDTLGACGSGGGGGGSGGGGGCVMTGLPCQGGGCCTSLTCVLPSGELCGADGMGCTCQVVIN